MNEQRVTPFIVAFLLAIVLLLSFTPLADLVVKYSNQDTLVKSNLKYLENIRNSGVDDMLLTAELSSLLSVVESSNIGISFIADMQVTVGQVLYPLTSIIEKVGLVSLASSTIAYSTSVLLTISEGSVYYLYILSISSLMVYFIAKSMWPNKSPTRFISFLKNVAYFFTVVLLFLHIILPYSIHSASLIDKAILCDIREQSSMQIKNIHSELIKSGTKQHNLKASAKDTVHSLSKIKHNVVDKVESTVYSLITKIAVLIIQGMVLPFIFILLGYKLLRRVLLVNINY
jgi:hypothetical protein